MNPMYLNMGMEGFRYNKVGLSNHVGHSNHLRLNYGTFVSDPVPRSILVGCDGTSFETPDVLLQHCNLVVISSIFLQVT